MENVVTRLPATSLMLLCLILALCRSVFVVEDDEEKRVPLPPLPLAIAPKGKLVLVDPPPKYTPPLLGDLRGSTN